MKQEITASVMLDALVLSDIDKNRLSSTGWSQKNRLLVTIEEGRLKTAGWK